ncbi:MAG: proteasome accessory factor PafA2 [Deltaproteobacteria bacterium]|nr:proteasome accessory factor PafA2 [Deltaproteobacteria bacterium]
MPLPSVMGSEIEYGITVQNDRDFDPISSCVLLVNCYQDDESAEILWDYDQENPLADARGFSVEGEKYTPNQQENIARNKTLKNGARFYVDHAHPEYSTPEVTNVRELIAYERAGERTLELARRAATILLPQGQMILIHKNNSDRKGNSYGNHENYLISRRTPFKDVVEHITPYLVTRQVFCGAGKVGTENRAQPCDYQISQRADFFETEVALDTMVKRPIVNTRDEPHADREKYRRLHIIVGDSNLSECATYLRTGVTGIVLALIEDGAIESGLGIREPVRAIKEISHDPECRYECQMERRGRMTAVQVQQEYLEAALRYFSSREIDPVTKDVMVRWERVLSKLAEDPMQLDREIDWVIKRKLMMGFMDRKGVDWAHPQIAMMDLQYHDVRPDKGLYLLLERRGAVERIISDEEIEQAMVHPPTDTRAYFRGECIRRYGSSVFGVNWDSISFNLGEEPIKRILMNEPLKGTKAHVGELLDSCATVEELVKHITT